MKKTILSAIIFLNAAAFAAYPAVDITLPDKTVIKAELAVTPQEQEMGLQFRTELAPDRGMLFTGDKERTRIFWMKNTYIPLDMLYIGQNRRVKKVFSDVRPVSPANPDEEPQIVTAEAKYVLELPAGTAKKHGIREGDSLLFKLPKGVEPDAADNGGGVKKASAKKKP
ncbi:MAG: DUF192 domain-containing protein [Elusimicrobiaceae bacterium]